MANSRLPAQRQKLIKNYLVEHGFASVEELGKQFKVSEMTIRRDLDELQRQGLLQRTYGGAMDSDVAFFEMSVTAKEDTFAREKARIGIAAAAMINDGDTVMLDSGTTTMQIACALRNKRLTVVTNALNIATELAKYPDIDILVAGGLLRKGPLNTVGPQTDHFIQELRVDKAFLGVEGVDLDYGISVPDPINVQNKQAMIKISNQSIVVTDHSKLGRSTTSSIASLEQIDLIITGKEADPELVKLLQTKVDLKLV